MTILSTTVTPTTAYLGETVTLTSEVSETISSSHLAMWIIDFDETTDSSTMIWEFLNQDRVLNYEWSPFVHKMDMSSEVQINGSMLGEHTLTFILGQGQGGISIANNPELFTISDPINVSFKMHLYDKVKKLGNQWFYLKDEINTLLGGKEDNANKVTSLSSSSTDTQYPSAKAVYDTIETKIDKLQRTVTTFNPRDYVVGEDDGANWANDDTVALPTRGNTITFNFTDMLNDTGDYFEWELGALHGSVSMSDGDDEHSDEIWNSTVNSMIRIKITKNEYSDSYHITTTDLSNNTIIKDYDKDYHFNLTFIPLIGVTVSFSNKKWYHTVSFIDMIYPIGSIYMSVNSINPSLFIGGTWEQLKDRFLLGSGDTYNAGTTGGRATVTLTSAQSGVPQHTHTYPHTDTTYKLNTTNRKPGTSTAVAYGTSITATANNTTKTSNNNTAANASQAHENMPPYLAVYMWERVG